MKMNYKALTVPLSLSCLMFVATTFAEEGPKMARVLPNVSATICQSPEKREECYAMIAAVAEMSRVIGEQAAVCGDDVNSKVCINSKTDSVIIQNWYNGSVKE